MRFELVVPAIGMQTTPDPPDSFSEAIDAAVDTLTGLWTGLVANLPLIVLGTLVIGLGWIVSRRLGSLAEGAVRRTPADGSVAVLTGRSVRAAILLLFVLMALAIAGISVSAALAGLGVVGLAVAFAVQSILGNFVSGLLLLVRKPFRVGEQIIANGNEGTVEDINLRVTKLITYDGEEVYVPNADVLSNTITNLTRRGSRRTTVTVGIDYRDDHNAVKTLLEAAVANVDGVLETPVPMVLCTELGDSSVNFEVRYWSRPEIAEVVTTRDRVFRMVKDTVEGAGMSIPWPIRTLDFDGPLRTEKGEGEPSS